jgi:hypothetical protein
MMYISRKAFIFQAVIMNADFFRRQTLWYETNDAKLMEESISSLRIEVQYGHNREKSI